MVRAFEATDAHNLQVSRSAAGFTLLVLLPIQRACNAGHVGLAAGLPCAVGNAHDPHMQAADAPGPG